MAYSGGWGSWGGDSQPLPSNKGVYGSAVSSSAGSGAEPRPPKGFLYSEPSDCLSQYLSTCCIQFACFSRGNIHIKYNIPPHI